VRISDVLGPEGDSGGRGVDRVLLREPFLKKLTINSIQPRAERCNTMLLLDQIPRPGAHTVWLASPALVASVVTDILNDVGAIDALDEVWLRKPSSVRQP
jgi:hypothetical protein